MSDDPKPSDPEKPTGEVEDFFQRLPANFRWPKPSAESVAAAMEAIQRASGGAGVVSNQPVRAVGGTAENAGTCAACGGVLPEGALFCVWCGAPRDGSPSAAINQHVHHHYHHLVPTQGTASTTAEAASSAPRGKAPGAGGGPAPGGRAEASARQMVQDWAQACNTRHIDDLVDLYAADAMLIRSSVPPVRSLPAIREFLLSMLAAGLGDVEMESVRLEIMGDIAMDVGRSKMLVPSATGKRREERGKYLIVMVRQPAGTWKILADCWSVDPAVAAPSAPDPPSKK